VFALKLLDNLNVDNKVALSIQNGICSVIWLCNRFLSALNYIKFKQMCKNVVSVDCSVLDQFGTVDSHVVAMTYCGRSWHLVMLHCDNGFFLSAVVFTFCVSE
jgi:hypothetical protein